MVETHPNSGGFGRVDRCWYEWSIMSVGVLLAALPAQGWCGMEGSEMSPPKQSEVWATAT